MIKISVFAVTVVGFAVILSSSQSQSPIVPKVLVVNDQSKPVPVSGSVQVSTSAPISVQVPTPMPVTATSPLAVKDADNAARHFVRQESTFNIGNDFIAVGSEVYSVPLGKRLVIEQVSVRASAFATLVAGVGAVADLVIKAPNNTTRLVTVPIDVKARNMSAFRRWFANEALTVYADEGEKVRIEVEFTGTVPPAASPTVAIIGHLVDKN